MNSLRLCASLWLVATFAFAVSALPDPGAYVEYGGALQHGLARISVTDPSVCVDDVDCGAHKFCEKQKRSGRCVARRALGENCLRNECVANATCVTYPTRRCVAKPALNGACYPGDVHSCANGLACVSQDLHKCPVGDACNGRVGKCRQPFMRRTYNQLCRFQGDCDQDRGFYCDSDFGRCDSKFPDGVPCANTFRDVMCRGFCARGGDSHSSGVCAPIQPLGGLCTEDRHCRQPYRDTVASSPPRDTVICNKPRGVDFPGVCARQSQLLRRLGAHCDANKDLCDARRGLSCRFAKHLGRLVCQQKYDRLANLQSPRGNTPCTPGNRLSSCPGPSQFFPTECRRRRGSPNSNLNRATETTVCSRRRRLVPAGTDCATERDFCAGGSVCRVVGGLLLQDVGPAKFGPEPAVYCVNELQQGASCSQADKFRAACAHGLSCVRGTCVKTPSQPLCFNVSHAYRLGSCAALPCAPGYTCGTDKLCRRADAQAGFGQLCVEYGVDAPRCKAGLVCRTRWGPRGLKRCGRAQGVGAYCESDRWCAGSLKCPKAVTPGREVADRRCYEPATALSIGQICDPSRQRSGPRCMNRPDSRGFTTDPLRCLRKKGGTFACQIEARLFETCSDSSRRVCADERLDCKKGVCVPRN